MAGRGHNVVVYTRCPVEQEFGKTVWRHIDTLPETLANEPEPVDVLVGWAWTPVLGGDWLNELVRLRIASEHTLDFPVADTERYIDLHFCQSNFHRNTLLHWDSTLDPAKVVVCPSSGVHLGEFKAFEDIKKRKDKFVWISSPDRGLHHVLAIWPAIRAKYPNAELDIFYATRDRFDAAIWGSSYESETLNFCRDRLDLPGVTLKGPRPRVEVLRALAECEVFFYPMDPIRWAENLCLSVQEAMAASCAVLTSDADCLQELYDGRAECIPQQKLWDREFLAAKLFNLLDDPESKGEMVYRGWELVGQCNIELVAQNWERVFYRELMERGHDCVCPSGWAGNETSGEGSRQTEMFGGRSW
jgi:glycosyltransferase involved in cell wall biosynthesis